MTGTVTDSTGAVLPGITVTVTHAGTGISSSAVTDRQGGYTIPLLPPGTYQATVEQSGFKKYLHGGIVVQIAQTTRLDIGLQVGAMSEAVEVVGEAPLVRSTTAELGQVIEMKQIQALPLNGRFFQHLITMTPGAMPVYSRGDSAENASAGGARIATAHTVNGMPWSGNNYLLDGVVNNEMQNAYINITPPLEAIQEFKVQTNNPTAEFGVFGGAAVNLTIRSGTNEFHGSLFNYLRDDAINSKNYFATTKAPYNSNQFGATLGGPIIKNKAFFGDTGPAADQGRTVILTSTALMRQGVFTEIKDVTTTRHRPAVCGQRHPRQPHQPHQPRDRGRHLPAAQPAGARQQLHREQRGPADPERGRCEGGLSDQRSRVAVRPVLDGEEALRRAGARKHLHGANNADNTNYNGPPAYADARVEQVLRVPRRLQPLLDAPVRGGLRS
jgi:hypothetical protein